MMSLWTFLIFFIPNEAKTYKPKEPPWLTSSCKVVYSKYKRKFKIFSQNNFPADQKQKIDELKENYTQMVTNEKEKYLSNLGNKLSDPQTGPKKYWNIIKKILKKNIASNIPPILYNNQFLVEAEEKCHIFNEFFRKQCVVPPTPSVLPLE